MYDYISSLYAALNVVGITGQLATYGPGTALFAESIIPSDCNEFPTINFYQSGIHDGKKEYGHSVYTVACRHPERKEAERIGDLVIDTINRINVFDYYISCVKLPCVPPMDDTDVFNQPIQTTIMKRS
jgi:hypothetical protein